MEYQAKLNMSLWISSMNMCKGFDAIVLFVLIGALRSKGLPHKYLSLLSILYTNQKVSTNRSSEPKIANGLNTI